jgi:hypothetical protein
MSSKEDRTLFELIFSSQCRKWERVRLFLLPLLVSSFDEDEEEKKNPGLRSKETSPIRVPAG